MVSQHKKIIKSTLERICVYLKAIVPFLVSTLAGIANAQVSDRCP